MEGIENAYQLSQVKEFGDRARAGELKEHSSQRYFTHPRRVMEICRAYREELPVLAAALLHDVLEETNITKEQLQNFLLSTMDRAYALRTLALVVEVTNVYTKSNYPNLNRENRTSREVKRLSRISVDAQTIKYADLLDNLNNISHYHPDSTTVYLKEAQDLLKHMKRGNRELHELAVSVIDECLETELQEESEPLQA